MSERFKFVIPGRPEHICTVRLAVGSVAAGCGFDVEEIEDIKRSEPYSLKYLVEDEEAARNKKDGIAKETEEYRKYRKELGEIILKMIAEGGLHFRVE